MQKSGVLAGLSLLAVVAVTVTGVSAQDAIANRKAYMKSVGAAAKASGEMIKGDKPYDAKAAAEALTKVATGWAGFATSFPKGSETGGETTASAKVWETPQDFDDKGKALAKAAETAAAEAAKGPEAFKAAFAGVGSTCKGCHEVYRVQKK